VDGEAPNNSKGRFKKCFKETPGESAFQPGANPILSQPVFCARADDARCAAMPLVNEQIKYHFETDACFVRPFKLGPWGANANRPRR